MGSNNRLEVVSYLGSSKMARQLRVLNFLVIDEPTPLNVGLPSIPMFSLRAGAGGASPSTQELLAIMGISPSRQIALANFPGTAASAFTYRVTKRMRSPVKVNHGWH